MAERGMKFIDAETKAEHTISIENGKFVLDAASAALALSASDDIEPSTDLLGKVVGNLQSNIVIKNKTVKGSLFPIDDYTGFSSNEAEQSGHFLALHFASEEGAVIKCNGVQLDADGIFVCRVASENSKITAVATKGNKSTTLELSLSGLTLLLN